MKLDQSTEVLESLVSSIDNENNTMIANIEQCQEDVYKLQNQRNFIDLDEVPGSQTLSFLSDLQALDQYLNEDYSWYNDLVLPYNSTSHDV